ncbi:ABC transporter permease [Salinibacterium sp. M195]|uniref:ABC transporter permease n=1 Tax=Salinibacterium sp. M195 TaxID=2583374 RepID=UPI001C639CEA|nr:ABC transporter permease [Salinibacterium sp. M195]QYH36149.1 ABC transporter permease [Salinibacterium sp. M195]
MSAKAAENPILRVLAKNNLWVALAVVVIALSIASTTFRNPANLQNILAQNGIIGIVAMGMLVMMISGGFDLSVGAIGGAVAVLAAFTSRELGLPAALLAGLILGTLLGLVNGLIIARLRINSFIATFALASIVTGVMFVITQGKSVGGKSAALQAFTYGSLGGISFIFLAFMTFAVLTHLILTRTKWGHWIFSAGANEHASYLSGVPVVPVKVAAFVFGGLATAVGGILMFGQSAIGQPTGADAWPLNAIAICVIGGTALSGGVGRVSNVIAATLLLGVIGNGMNQLGVSPYWQPAVTGAIILAAVIADRAGRARDSDH